MKLWKDNIYHLFIQCGILKLIQNLKLKELTIYNGVIVEATHALLITMSSGVAMSGLVQT